MLALALATASVLGFVQHEPQALVSKASDSSKVKLEWYSVAW